MIDAKSLLPEKIRKSFLEQFFDTLLDIFFIFQSNRLIGSESDVKHIADFISHSYRFLMPVRLDDSRNF